MDDRGGAAQRTRRREARRIRTRRGRRIVVGVLVLAAAAATGVALWPHSAPRTPVGRRTDPPVAAAHRVHAKARHAVRRPSGAAVPILMYHVIAAPIPGARFPGLYVDPGSFRAQMHALAEAGYDAVTLDQVRRAWLGRGTLPKQPIVISFDNGYRTQYTEALPILRRLGWVAVENLQLTGLPPSAGGLAPWEVRRLVASGWELDTQGESHADLIALDAAQLTFQIRDARETLRREYHVPVDWFCYPSGYYDLAVAAEVAAAGFVGATTVVPGWARPGESPYTLPRLRVLGGTTPAELLRLIQATRGAPSPPAEYPS